MKATILIHCPDQAGIISAVTGYIFRQGGNIEYLDQHVDLQAGIFFMRLEAIFGGQAAFNKFEAGFPEELATPFDLQYKIFPGDEKPRMAIFVSRYKHCLYDLLGRYHAGEIQVEIPVILSNHQDLEPIARQFGVPFHHVPFNKENRDEATLRQLALLQEYQVDFIVLARYMQIIPPSMIEAYRNKIINIHHSFLPAFAGAKPYHAAFNRGVKIIGATSHYVTEELDEGPIIAQDVTPVSHAHTVKDLIAKGRDLEKIVLARAVELHISRKTTVYNNKTVIFT